MCRDLEAAQQLAPGTILKVKIVDLKPADEINLILSTNVQQRHLTTGQRSMLAAGVGEITKYSLAQRAGMFKISVITVQYAETVRKSGDWTLIAEVESGHLKVSAARKKIVDREKALQKSDVASEMAASATAEGASIDGSSTTQLHKDVSVRLERSRLRLRALGVKGLNALLAVVSTPSCAPVTNR